MFQIHHHSGIWPRLDLDRFLDFLALALTLKDRDVITLVLGDKGFVRSLNATYRGQDRSTNVLSFPSDADDELGDLIFAVETIRQEAEMQGKPFDHHLMHLIVHGSLHLQGHDHEIEAQAEVMEALETQILGEFGLPDPYSECNVRI